MWLLEGEPAVVYIRLGILAGIVVMALIGLWVFALS